MEFRDVLHVLVDSATFAGDSIANNDLKAEAHTAVDDYLGKGTDPVHPDHLAAPVDPVAAEVMPQSLDANQAQEQAPEVAAGPPDSTQPAAS